jgi:hypothetical protein
MGAAVYQLWSWNARGQDWTSVNEGPRAEMEAAATRLYASADVARIIGAAYLVQQAVPGGTPSDYGIGIVELNQYERELMTAADLIPSRSDAMVEYPRKLGYARRKLLIETSRNTGPGTPTLRLSVREDNADQVLLLEVELTGDDVLKMLSTQTVRAVGQVRRGQ